MTSILDQLHFIEKEKVIYDIHYCRAGVGFIFYEPPEDTPINEHPDNWKDYLTCHNYYKTFEQAVDAEYTRITQKYQEGL